MCKELLSSPPCRELWPRPISQPTGAVGSCNTQSGSQSIRHLRSLNTVWWTLRSKSPKRFLGMIEGHHRWHWRGGKNENSCLTLEPSRYRPIALHFSKYCDMLRWKRAVKMHRPVSSSNPKESLAYHSLTIPPSSIWGSNLAANYAPTNRITMNGFVSHFSYPCRVCHPYLSKAIL